MDAVARARLAGVRQAGPGRVEHGHHQGDASPSSCRRPIEAAREHDPKVVVEAAIVGREIECAVLQGRDGAAPRTSELGEIAVVQGHEFYDFEAKYLAEADVRLDLPGRRARRRSPTEVRGVAAAAFEAAGCEGLARVDCFYTDDGDVVVNEINTMPGFTPHSMYPRMWAALGLGYPELIDELVQLALTPPDRPALSRAACAGQPLQRCVALGNGLRRPGERPEQQRLGA